MHIESFVEKPLQAKGKYVCNPKPPSRVLSRGQNWQLLMKGEGRVTPPSTRHSEDVHELKSLLERSDA